MEYEKLEVIPSNTHVIDPYASHVPKVVVGLVLLFLITIHYGGFLSDQLTYLALGCGLVLALIAIFFFKKKN